MTVKRGPVSLDVFFAGVGMRTSVRLQLCRTYTEVTRRAQSMGERDDRQNEWDADETGGKKEKRENNP